LVPGRGRAALPAFFYLPAMGTEWRKGACCLEALCLIEIAELNDQNIAQEICGIRRESAEKKARQIQINLL
jgi:hypothetical protein